MLLLLIIKNVNYKKSKIFDIKTYIKLIKLWVRFWYRPVIIKYKFKNDCTKLSWGFRFFGCNYKLS